MSGEERGGRIAANKLELLRVSEAVAREKGIEKSVVVDAIAEAIQRVARTRYGSENDIRADVDPETLEIRLVRLREVVEIEEVPARQVSLEEARRMNPAAQIGDSISEELPSMDPSDFGRVSAQSAKQVILQKVRDAERERQYEEYKNRIGEIINGTVKRVEYGNVVIDLGLGEGVARREELLAREKLREGDRIQAYIYDVRSETRGAQVFLSRAHPQFMAKLFMREVPEIYEGVVEIKGVVRDAGSRAKIAVVSKDSSIDPVGACVGLRGSRVQAVVNELQGEKIDIVPWSGDQGELIVRALSPAEVVKVVLDDTAGRAMVVVPDDQLSLAIGRRGQNVRLAGQLVGWMIDVVTESEDSARRQKEFAERTALFMEELEIDEVIAQLLASEEFADIEEVAYVVPEELTAIEGLSEEVVERLQAKAVAWLAKRDEALEGERVELGVEDALAGLEGVVPAISVQLGKNKICTVQDLADLATDELTGGYEMEGGERKHYAGVLEGMVNGEEASALIMAARVAVGMVDASVLEGSEEASGEAEVGEQAEVGEEEEVS